MLHYMKKAVVSKAFFFLRNPMELRDIRPVCIIRNYFLVEG